MTTRIDDTEIEAAGATSFAAARDKLKQRPARSGSRREGEHRLAKSGRRPARTTGRTELFAFRARPDLKPTLEKIAEARTQQEGRKVSLAEVMEQALDGYIAAQRKK